MDANTSYLWFPEPEYNLTLITGGDDDDWYHGVHDDEVFDGYVPTATDPGSTLLAATLVFAFLINMTLPCWLSLGRKYDRLAEEEAEAFDARLRAEVAQTAETVGAAAMALEQQEEEEDHGIIDCSGSDTGSFAGFIPPTLSPSRIPPKNLLKMPSPRSPSHSPSTGNTTNDNCSRSVASADSGINSIISKASSIVMPNTAPRGRVMRQLQREHLDEYDHLHHYPEGEKLHKEPVKNNHVHDIYNRNYPDDELSLDRRSYLGKMDIDEISINDAVSSYSYNTQNTRNNNNNIGTTNKHSSNDDAMAVGAACEVSKVGEYHHPGSDHPSNTTSAPPRNMFTKLFDFTNQVIKIAEFDFQMKRIFKLALPFVAEAFTVGLIDIIQVAVIGTFLGTRQVSAYIMVELVVGFVSEMLGAFSESLTTLCSQAHGNKSYKLAGQYVQLSIVFYVIGYLPFILIFSFYTRPIVLWFGFDEGTAIIAQQYATIGVYTDLLQGISEPIYELLGVIGLENYAMYMSVSGTIVSFLDVVCFVVLTNPDLTLIAWLELIVEGVFFIMNIVIIQSCGWFEKYNRGLLYSNALRNTKAVCLMLKTSSSLMIGYVLIEGEWEIMTFFASMLGPAEVTAWGILGTIWGAIEMLVEAIGDASEVRVAFLLGSGQWEKAELVAYKSILIAIFVSVIVTSTILICGSHLSGWITSDATLQGMITNLLPLFSVGNIALTLGQTSWTLLGAQGRYRLASFIAIGASWFVTLPLAVIFTLCLNINLQGQTSALVIGYSVSGTINAYFLFRSNWEKLSQQVMEANASSDDEDSDSDDDDDSDIDDDDSSTSSSGSSSGSNGNSSNGSNKVSHENNTEGSKENTSSSLSPSSSTAKGNNGDINNDVVGDGKNCNEKDMEDDESSFDLSSNKTDYLSGSDADSIHRYQSPTVLGIQSLPYHDYENANTSLEEDNNSLLETTNSDVSSRTALSLVAEVPFHDDSARTGASADTFVTCMDSALKLLPSVTTHNSGTNHYNSSTEIPAVIPAVNSSYSTSSISPIKTRVLLSSPISSQLPQEKTVLTTTPATVTDDSYDSDDGRNVLV